MNKRRKTKKVSHLFVDSKFRALIEKSTDVIIVVDKYGKILYASPSIVRLYGRPFSEILGFSSLKFVHPADVPRLAKSLACLVLHSNKTIADEYRVRHKNGEWRWIEGVGTNLLHDKHVQGIVVNFHDITDRKKLEDRKNEFISVASHELKTPITALQAYVQLLKRLFDGKDNKAWIYLEKIETQMKRLTLLINELLDVSRIQEGKLELRKTSFYIDELLKEVILDMQQLTNSQEIILRKSPKRKLYADKYRITQVLINLLSNAIKYSPSKSPIIVRCREKNRVFFITVKDFGNGIAKENQKKIFDRFYQEDNRKNHNPGLGLGLYICSMFIKQHEGRIWCRSSVGKGSSFTFSLPLIRVARSV